MNLLSPKKMQRAIQETKNMMVGLSTMGEGFAVFEKHLQKLLVQSGAIKVRPADEVLQKRRSGPRQVIDGRLNCSRCKTLKPVKAFCKSKRTNCGYQSCCGHCTAKYAKEYRAKKKLQKG